jgi:hypothetical protein
MRGSWLHPDTTTSAGGSRRQKKTPLRSGSNHLMQRGYSFGDPKKVQKAQNKVGAPGFEPGASCTPCKRASQAAPRPVWCVHNSLQRPKSQYWICGAAEGNRDQTPEKRTTSEGWHRPSLPGGSPPSTIGAGGLNDRVREGTGCTPTATDTNHLTSDDTASWIAGLSVVHKRDARRPISPYHGG